MPILKILKGPPATGKSTYRKQVIDTDDTYRYVNLDELRLQHPTKREHELHEIQRERVQYYKNRGFNIIIDNTNLNPNTLEHWINWAKNNHYDFEIKEFGRDISMWEAIRRDAIREKSVGKSVIIQMYMDAGLFERNIQPAVILDLDGTLCDVTHRRVYVENTDKKDWNRFFEGIPHDKPDQAVTLLYDMIYTYSRTIEPLDIIFVSGRPQQYRAVTEQWLKQHQFSEYFVLFMRPFNNNDDDSIVKINIYNKYIKPWFDVKFVVDDRNRVVNAWRAAGLKCFQVEEGNF